MAKKKRGHRLRSVVELGVNFFLARVLMVSPPPRSLYLFRILDGLEREEVRGGGNKANLAAKSRSDVFCEKL